MQGFSAFLRQIRHTSVLSKEDELELTLFIQRGNILCRLGDESCQRTGTKPDIRQLSEISGLVIRYIFLVYMEFTLIHVVCGRRVIYLRTWPSGKEGAD